MKTIELLRRRTAEIAIGPSALRNQGNKNVVKAAREYLKTIQPAEFRVRSRKQFLLVLDRKTELMRRSLPPRSKYWGAARKAINLFLRDVLYDCVPFLVEI